MPPWRPLAAGALGFLLAALLFSSELRLLRSAWRTGAPHAVLGGHRARQQRLSAAPAAAEQVVVLAVRDDAAGRAHREEGDDADDDARLPTVRQALLSRAPTAPRVTPSPTRSAAKNYAAVRRYLTSPFRMQPLDDAPEGAERCFSSPYWAGGDAARAATREQRAAAVAHFAAAVAYAEGPLAGAKAARCRAAKGLRLHRTARECPVQAMCAPTSSAPGGGDARKSVATTLEVAYDLLAVQPPAYAASLAGDLARVACTPGGAAFYFFAPGRVCERLDWARAWAPLSSIDTPWPHSAAQSTVANALVTVDVRTMMGDSWRLPPFYGHYCGWGLHWWAGQPHVVIFNKRPLQERGGPPVNVMDAAVLAELFDALSPRYVVVYVRAPPGLMDGDEQGVSDVHDDIDALVEHAVAKLGREQAFKRLVVWPWVVAEMQAAAADASQPMNAHEVLLATLADADGIIAAQGGATYLSLLWGPHARVVTLEIKGLEAALNAVQWYPVLSNTSRVESARSLGQLLPAVRRVLLE